MENKLENHKTKCRLCLQKPGRSSVKISDDIGDDFFRLTNLKLIFSSKYSSSACQSCVDDLKSSLEIQRKMINIQQSLYQLEKDIATVKVEETANFEPVAVKTECFDFGSLGEQSWVDDSKAGQEVCVGTLPVIDESEQEKIGDDGSSSDSDNYFLGDHSESTGELFVCQLCNKALPNDDELTSHLKAHEEKKKSEIETAGGKARVVCHYCGQVLSPATIVYHIQTHENKINNTPLQCDQCSFECFNKGNIKIHMKAHRKDATRFKCSYCPKSFLHKWPRTHHERTLHNKEYGKYKCEQCGTKFDTPTGLKNHQKSIHLSGRFMCRFCKVVIFNKGEYNLHVRKHRKKIPCEVCGVKFIIGDSYTKHLSSHGPAGFKCLENGCRQKFYTKTALEKHFKASHGPKKDIACNLCGALFHTEHHLKRHVGRQHVEPSFFCEIEDCNYSTGRKEYIVMHLNNHKRIDPAVRQELLSRVRART